MSELQNKERQKNQNQQGQTKKKNTPYSVQRLVGTPPSSSTNSLLAGINAKNQGVQPYQMKRPSSNSNGLPLEVQAKMENSLGHDFSNVNIHKDSQNATDAGALAYAQGNDVHFAPGQFKPDTTNGQELIGHELAHVVQQREGRVKPTKVLGKGMAVNDDPSLEKEADEMGRKASNSTWDQTKLGILKDDIKQMVLSPTAQLQTEYSSGTPINVSYSVPLDKNNIQASAGETLIFGVVATDKDQTRSTPGAWVQQDGQGPYEIRYSVVGDAEFNQAGSGDTTFVHNGLSSRNVYLITKKSWKKKQIKVTAVIKDLASNAKAPDKGSTKDPDVRITWTIIPRKNPIPKTLTKNSGPVGGAWANAPAVYGYKAGPDIGNDGKTDYQGQTVLEEFNDVSPLYFAMGDLKADWKRNNPSINTPQKVARFLWNTSGNGTFVFNVRDEIYDQHSGFGTLSPFKNSAFSGSGVGYLKAQTYKCGSSTIGTCNIYRRYTAANGVQIKKTNPK